MDRCIRPTVLAKLAAKYLHRPLPVKVKDHLGMCADCKSQYDSHRAYLLSAESTEVKRRRWLK